MSHGRRRLSNLLLVLASIAVTLLGLELALRALTRGGGVLGTKLAGPGIIDCERIRAQTAALLGIYDPELGWVAPSDTSGGPTGDPGGGPTGDPGGGPTGDTSGESNPGEARAAAAAGGPRGPRRYAPEVPPGVLRVSAFGESFTRGDGVPPGASWPAQIEAGSGGRIEVLNFGVGGYGLDQVYLCFRRRAAAYHPDLVLVGLTHHAIERTTNLYHPFYTPDTGFGLAKPRFVLDGDSLRPVLAVVPAPAAFLDFYPGFGHHPLRRYEAYYDPALYGRSRADRSRLIWFVRSRFAWHRRVERFAAERIMDPDGEEIRLARALTCRMAKEAGALGAGFAAVILPTHRMLRLLAAGQDLWAPFRSDLAAAGIPIWDVQAAFARDPAFGRYFLPDGHLTADGNGRVAAEVLGHLTAARPAGPGLGR